MSRFFSLMLIVSSNICFSQILVQGPEAPDLNAWFENGVITITLSDDNPESNNYQQGYLIYDEIADDFWTFEGYLIYQVKQPFPEFNLEDLEHFRIIAQSDIENDFSDLVNWHLDSLTSQCVPYLGVIGANSGLQFEYQITQDAFADEKVGLIEGESYCFLAIAYASNPNGSSGEGCELFPSTFLSTNPSSLIAEDVKCVSANILNVNPLKEKSELKFWNSSELLFIESAAELEGELTIYSLDGRKEESVSIEHTNNYSWNFSHLNSGIYLAHFSSGSEQYLKRFIVAN